MADETKAKPVTHRLLSPVLEAVERYRADREREIRRMVPYFEMSLAAALSEAVAMHMQSRGYLPTDEPEAPEATEKPVAEERRKLPRVKPVTERDKRREGIEADLIAGTMTGADISRKWGIDQGRISRIKKQLKEEGRLS